ncbi:MAG: YafY family transcriptional regulator [Lachnospiraceae bacterium]|nr:YafY family transcriptional regulator [Lachnospiraceae bacterium]
MKIDRLIGILSILLQKEMTTAPELAEHFEVSRRTINRDIEDLCKAGIPIQTTQGVGGGISIMSGYRMDRTILTSRDMQMILAGLRSLDSVSGSSYYSQLMEKIQAGSSELVSGKESVLIDLSSWYKATLAPKISMIQDAIESRHLIKFKYFAPSGESVRTVEPYYVVFKWTSWYVYGWCLKRKDYRLFKLNRMDKVELTNKEFECRNVPLPDMSAELLYPRNIKVKALFDADMKWRLVEEFGMECYSERKDGKLLFEEYYSDMDNLVSWMLTFGDKVEVLEPEEVRERLKVMADNMIKVYGRKKKSGTD